MFLHVSEKSVDVSKLFAQFSLDVVLSTSFGLKADIQTNPERVEKAATAYIVPVYARVLTMLPFYRHLKKYLNFDPIQHVPYFENLVKDVLDLRRRHSTGCRRDLLQLMLEAKEVNDNQIKTLTDEEIIGQCIITFLVAGSESVGSTLAFTAFYLAHHPEVQEKLLREIDDAVASRGDVSTYDFVHAVLNTSIESFPKCWALP